MRLAWFRPAPSGHSAPLDDTALLIAELARQHAVEPFDRTHAHDFVWMHARDPYDLCIYELADTSVHDYVWPYLLHFPGVLRLRGPSLHESRVSALFRARRSDDYSTERHFGEWDMLRAPLLASRLVVVADERLARRLQDDHPEARIRHAPIGIGHDAGSRIPGPGPVRFGVLESAHLAVIERAAARARDAGAQMEVVSAASAEDALRDSDVIVALDWPSAGEPPVAAVAGMARAKAVIVFETEATAFWPALDPQTWRPRGLESTEPSVVVSIDLRDEEHSLMLAIRRLAADQALRDQLGAAAFEWWSRTATVERAATAWQRIIGEAATLAAPAPPSGWPLHLTADGSEHARAILKQFDVAVDFLR